MNAIKLSLTFLTGIFLFACSDGGSVSVAPDAPTAVKVAAGPAVGTSASVSFTEPAFKGTSPVISYTVTANPGGITATGSASPIIVTGLTPGTAYTFSVAATNSQGSSATASVTNTNNYSVIATFLEPMTQPNNSIFTGTFTYDAVSQTVSNLKGSLTESMTMMPPMTTVALNNQLSSISDGAGGLLVTTFALNTTNTFTTDPMMGGTDGWAPGSGSSMYYGFGTVTPNPGNAYARIYVNLTDPTIALTQVQLDKLAYADCAPGGMMGAMCMTGTTVAGYGSVGTMNGYPVSQVITKQ